MNTHGRIGFTRSEVSVCIGVAIVLGAIVIPLTGAGRSRSRELASLSNLKTLAGAHAAYAADWGDRQFTHMPEGMGQAPGYQSYLQQFGCPPSIVLGHGGSFPSNGSEQTWAYWMPCADPGGAATNFNHLWPFVFGGAGEGNGMWRMQNIAGFNEYVGGRFIDKTFYAPADFQAMSVVGPGLESPNSYTFFGDGKHESAQSSYVASPPAMFHPDVFGGTNGLFKPPTSFAQSSVSPTVSQCAYPDLKTRLIEHRWCQSPPRLMDFLTKEQPYFNLGADSVPMTMFFDGHTAALPVRRVLADNAAVVQGGGKPLWVIPCGSGPWCGYGGYYCIPAGFDTSDTSFHVFTRYGILGRDVITAP